MPSLKTVARHTRRRLRKLERRLRTPYPNVEQGYGSYGDYRVIFWEHDPRPWVRIGKFCSIAEGVEFIIGGDHLLENASSYPFLINLGLPGGRRTEARDTIVGNDVWIGRNATILPGVKIGDGAVIGAQCVVARDVAPYTVVVGNPARDIKQRFEDGSVVAAMLELAWWDWPLEELHSIAHLLNGDPQALVEYGRNRIVALSVNVR